MEKTEHIHPNAYDAGTTTHAHVISGETTDYKGRHAHLDAGLNIAYPLVRNEDSRPR